jgi:Kiwa KwaB-like protein
VNTRVELQSALEKLKALSQIEVASCDAHLCLASITNEDVPLLQRVQVSQSVQAEFKAIAADMIAEIESNLGASEITLHKYNPLSKLDSHEVEYLNLAEHPALGGQVAVSRSPLDMDLFSANDQFIEGLRFYAIVLHPAGMEPVILFRTYSHSKELTRSSKLAVLFENGQYDKIEDPVFVFDHQIDCIATGDSLFIFRKHNFQQIFRFYEMVEAAAKVTLQAIKKHIPIENFETFEESCYKHKQKLAKLKNIANKPYLNSLTIKHLKKVIKHHRLPITTIGAGKKEKIVFEASDKWAILRLLDDDYLDSYMTGIKYEVNSKREQSH